MDRRMTYAERLQQILGLLVNIQLAALAVLAEVERRDFRNILILALTLFFLELERDTANGSTLDTLHQVGSVTGDLVPKALGGNDGDFIADALVGLEVESELRVVSLNDDLGGLLDGLRVRMSVRVLRVLRKA